MKKILFFLLVSTVAFGQRQRSLQIDADTTTRPDAGKYGLAAKSGRFYLVPRAGNVVKMLSETYPGSGYIVTVGTVTSGTWQGTAIANSYIASGLDAAKIGGGAVSNTEYSYLDGVTSAIQTQLNGRQPLDADLTTLAAITPTTIGQNLLGLTNPSAISFPRFNADNTISALDAASFRTAIGAGTSSTSGTVTSVGLSVPSFLSVSGTPITSSGTLAITLSGTALPLSSGGLGATDAATARSNLGLVIGTNVQAFDSDLSTYAGITPTTIGQNLLALTNPSAITFPRFNANNTVSALDAASFRTAIGAGTSSTSGTVTSVGGTGTVSGISLSGTVTSSGSLTLGGTLAVTPSNFASQTANTVLAAPNGSAGVPSFRALVSADIPSRLNLAGDGSVVLQLGAGQAVRNPVSNFWDQGSGGSGDLYFRAGSSFVNSMTMLNNAKILIGTTTTDSGSGAKLQVSGGMQLVPSSAPASPVNGSLYYDSTTHKFRGYANGAWVDLH